jgi:hypothetical protein
MTRHLSLTDSASHPAPRARRAVGRRRACWVAAAWTLAACALASPPAHAQSVELLAGNKKATQDVMFFRFFEGPAAATGKPTRSDVLFFFRARASTGYASPDTAPQFGLTSALSYNPAVLGGFAPVLVAQAFNRGVFPKAGVQYAHVTPHLVFFSWLTSELEARPTLDYFLLARYTHPLGDLLGLFAQVESVNALPTDPDATFTFIERARLGLQVHRFQVGPALDVTSVGRGSFTHTLNVGGFLRFEL